MTLEPLVPLLRARLSPQAQAWLDEALAACRDGLTTPAFAARWSAAGRMLGRDRLEGAAFCADELGRALLLTAACRATGAAEGQSAIAELFRAGELREQQALVKALFHLPGAGRFAGVAENAVRTNALSLLEALACENPFPAAHLPELPFNQLIMKSLFNGLRLERVVGLAQRRGAELSRMAAAWKSERLAAGRTVPDDLKLVL